MQVSYELRLDDLYAFVDFETMPVKKRRLVSLAPLLFFIPAMAYLVTQLPLNTALLFVIPLLVFVVTLIRGLRMTAPGRAKIKNNFCGTCQLKIELDGLAEVRSSGELKRNWSAIDRIVTTPTHLFIYATGLIAFIVPRRAFFDEADFKRFVKAIEDRAPVPNAVKHFCS